MRSGFVAAFKDSSSVFSLALENIIATMELYSVLTAKTVVLEPLRVVEETAAAPLSGRISRRLT